MVRPDNEEENASFRATLSGKKKAKKEDGRRAGGTRKSGPKNCFSKFLQRIKKERKVENSQQKVFCQRASVAKKKKEEETKKGKKRWGCSLGALRVHGKEWGQGGGGYYTEKVKTPRQIKPRLLARPDCGRKRGSHARREIATENLIAKTISAKRGVDSKKRIPWSEKNLSAFSLKTTKGLSSGGRKKALSPRTNRFGGEMSKKKRKTK